MFNYLKKAAINASLKKKFFMLTLLISIMPVTFVGFFSYKMFVQYLEEGATSTAVLKFEVINSRLERYLSNIDDTSTELMSNSSVQRLLRSTDRSDRYKYENEVRKSISLVLSSKVQIHSIMLYDMEGNLVAFGSNEDLMGFERRIFSKKSIKDYDVFEYVENLKGKRVWTKFLDDTDKISLVRIVNELGAQKQLGALVINLYGDGVKSIIEGIDLKAEGDFIIFDQNKNIIYSTNSKMHTDNVFDVPDNISGYRIKEFNGENYLNVYYTSKFCEWKMISMVPLRKLFSRVVIIKNMTLSVIAVCLAILVVFSIAITSFLTKPIIKLSKLMGEAEEGNLEVKFENNYNDEIGKLGQSFNAMISKLKALLSENRDKQKKLRAQELKALQMQINPHFLYNTMDTINWMAQSIDAEQISNISIAMSNYYRLSLSKGAEIIRISDEVNQVKNYLTIQKIRYDDLINYEIDIDESIVDMFIVKLTLQPIIENAIYHGLRDLDEGGMIRLTGRLENKKVIFEVLDDGMGMSTETLFKLRSSLRGSSSEGYGLSNVNERTKLYFGEEYGISVESSENEYTLVRVTIPAVGNVEKYLNF